MRPLLAFLLLSACSAQAHEPELDGFEKMRIETFVARECVTDEPDCATRCGNKFTGLDFDTTLQHEACLKAATEKFLGGDA